MILTLPTKKPKPDVTEWHEVWCLVPRRIDNSFVWLSKIERRLVATRISGASDLPYRVWKYRLIEYYSI